MIKYEDENREVAKSAPWVSYYHGLKELFEGDPDVSMEFSEDEPEIIIRVVGQDKYAALAKLIPEEKEYGNVTLRIKIVPSNTVKSSAKLFDDAFSGNPNYAFTKVVSSPMMSNPMTFVVFQKKVAQFFDDNLGDIYGNRNTLYECLAKETFETPDGVFYCTEAGTIE